MIYKKEKTVKTKICIVGSGLGGGTIAIKLAEENIDFIIVEAGGVTRNSDNVSFENVGREFGLRTTNSIQLGGTANLWHGVLSPLDKIDFQKRDWIPKSGWPITLEDLEPFYKNAADLLGIKDYNLFDIAKIPNSMKEKFSNIKFNKNILINKMFQQALPEKNFKSDILKIVKNSNNFHLYMDTVALELYKNDNCISGLKVGSKDGSTFEIYAEKFIVAAGALETPRLLLNSHIKNNNIGKFLMDHPMANLCQVKSKKKQKAHLYSAIKYIPSVAIKTGLELREEIQKKLKLPNHTFYMRPSLTEGIDNETEKIKLSLLAFRDGGLTLRDVWNVLTNLNVIFQSIVYKFSLNPKSKYFDMFFVTEQIPSENSRVKLSSKVDKWGYPISKVNWQLSDYDKSSMIKWYKLLEDECFNKDDYIFTYKFDKNDWSKNYTSAAHHVGTAKMAVSLDEGVVDSNLKVFTTNNLYVCDGSVFSTSGNVNNGLTIAALACKLAHYLSNEEIKD
jgi:hypothetical protein